MRSVITMKTLGSQGRFGNQVLEYMFLHVYAKRHNLEVQVPKWVGCYLYGFDDPPITVTLPTLREEHLGDARTLKSPPKGETCVDKNFLGYAQYCMSYYRPDKEFIQNLFTPLPAHRDRVQPAVDLLRSKGRTLVGIHIRRGDYGRMCYYCTPVEWYLTWLKRYWPTFDNPVLFVATEDRQLKSSFAAYNPHLVEDLGITLSKEPYPFYDYLEYDLKQRDSWQMDFFPEFHVLASCDVIAAANSTYSFVPAVLNPKLQRFFRSSLRTLELTEIDVWDTWPVLKDHAEDYKHVDGLRTAKNPYWDDYSPRNLES